MTDLNAEMLAARDLLLQSRTRVLSRKVRCVAHGNELEDPCVDALYTLACGRKFQWTPADWKTVEVKLDSCELTVGEWLDALTTESA